MRSAGAALYTVCKAAPVQLTFDDLGIPPDPPGFANAYPGGRPIPIGSLPGFTPFLYHGLNISAPSEGALSCHCLPSV